MRPVTFQEAMFWLGLAAAGLLIALLFGGQIRHATAGELSADGVKRGLAHIGVAPSMSARRIDPLSPQEYRLESLHATVAPYGHKSRITITIDVTPVSGRKDY